MLTANWTFQKLKGEAGKIRVVEWQIKWTDQSFPGVELTSGGESVIEPLTASTASKAKLRDAVIKVLGQQYLDIQNYISGQMGHQFEAGQFAELSSQLVEPPDLAAYTAQKRWEAEIGGAEWDGFPVHTDRDSQGKIVAEMLAVERGMRTDGDPWKFADGNFRPLTNDEMNEVALAVRNHIRQCFGTEAYVLAGIAGGSMTSIAEIDAAFSGFAAFA
jgi:hypothetical protein